MLQQDEPDDYVIATGETHTVRDLLDIAFHRAGVGDWEPHVRQDSRLLRPAEVDTLAGDSSRARERLGWKPRGNFRDLIEMMVDADLADLTRADPASDPTDREDPRWA